MSSLIAPPSRAQLRARLLKTLILPQAMGETFRALVMEKAISR